MKEDRLQNTPPIISRPISRDFQYVMPSGFTVAFLFFLAKRQSDVVIGVMLPHEVHTFEVVAYYLVSFGLSVAFTVAVPLPASRFIERLARRWRLWAWTLPIVIPALLWCCTYASAHADRSFAYMFCGLTFLASLVWVAYCGFLWPQRLVVYGYQKVRHKTSAEQE